jgi:MFS family permease
MHWLVGGGLVLSGLGGLLLLAGSGIGWVFAAVVLVGIGQSLSISAQSALVSDHCEDAIARLGEGTVYGVYRLLERLGNAVGPLIAGVLVLKLGYQPSFIVIGATVATCGVLFLAAAHRGAQLKFKPA